MPLQTLTASQQDTARALSQARSAQGAAEDAQADAAQALQRAEGRERRSRELAQRAEDDANALRAKVALLQSELVVGGE